VILPSLVFPGLGFVTPTAPLNVFENYQQHDYDCHHHHGQIEGLIVEGRPQVKSEK